LTKKEDEKQYNFEEIKTKMSDIIKKKLD